MTTVDILIAIGLAAVVGVLSFFAGRRHRPAGGGWSARAAEARATEAGAADARARSASVSAPHDVSLPLGDAGASDAETIRRDFVANVSHELKSPVTAIGLLAEAAEEAADSPDVVRDFIGRMRRESARLGTLITELIVLSSIQGGSLAEAEPVAIGEVLSDAVDRAMVAASAKDITLRVDGPVEGVVIGDRTLLTTAVGNLVDNAVRYSGTGSTVRLRSAARRGHVDIAVADDGIGIDLRDQRRVFERFFRSDPARSRETGGTGLGLAIVKHAAANHGGSIRLSSQLGVGSTFTLRLPLANRAARRRSGDLRSGDAPGERPKREAT